MAAYVLDANVVVKWSVQEDLWEQAHALRRRADELMAPNLILVEVLNALTQKLRVRALTEDVVRSAYPDMVDSLLLFPMTALVGPALNLSIQLGINMYDAVYVALAMQEGCRLVTADGGLTNSTSRLLREMVLPLGEVLLG